MNVPIRFVILDPIRAQAHDFSHPSGFGFEFGQTEKASQQIGESEHLCGRKFHADDAIAKIG